MKPLKITPRYARYYLFFAFLLIAAPTIFYKLLPSHAGKVLVAAPHSNDVNFARTLVYMDIHHGYGASGYILNKPLGHADIEKLKSRFPFAQSPQFYDGGPVERGISIFFLLPHDEGWSGFNIYNADTLQSENPDLYNTIISNPSLRILSGYAGWYGFQLNREIMRGGWDVLDYDGELIAGKNQEESWRKAMERVIAEKNIIRPAI
jgi:putative AlgH/UPF0301 family transcriptional regulator